MGGFADGQGETLIQELSLCPRSLGPSDRPATPTRKTINRQNKRAGRFQIELHQQCTEGIHIMPRSLSHALAPQSRGVLRGDVLRCDPWQNSAWVRKQESFVVGSIGSIVGKWDLGVALVFVLDPF